MLLWFSMGFCLVVYILKISPKSCHFFVLLFQDAPCKYENSNVVTNVTGCKQIEEDSESDLQQAVATIGPISVGIDATLLFHGYKSGN